MVNCEELRDVSGDIFYDIPLGLLTVLAIGMFSASAELGFRFGRRAAGRVSPEVHPHVATIEGALLGLLDVQQAMQDFGP